MAWYDELQRRSTSAETAARLYDARGGIDVVETRRGSPSRRWSRTPRRPGRARRGGPAAGALIPGARLVLLESANHILLGGRAGVAGFLAQLRAFLGTDRAVRAPPLEISAPASSRCSELVAAGLTNEAIALRLFLSVRTVERHPLERVREAAGSRARRHGAAAAASYSRRRASTLAHPG